MRSGAAAVVLAAGTLLLGVGSAGAHPARPVDEIIKKDKAGDVNAKGLTKAEREALDVVSVQASGQEGIGLFVTVTFKGNFEQAVGRSHLKDAYAALVLVPKPGKGTPAGVITQGAGSVGKVYRATKSKDVGAVRNGKELTFFVAGPGSNNVQTIQVITRAQAPPGAKRTPAAAAQGEIPYIGPSLFRLWRTTPADVFELGEWVDHADDLECDELEDLLDEIDARLARLARLPPTLVNLWMRGALARMGDYVEEILDEECGPPLALAFAWTFFGANELAGAGMLTGPVALKFNLIRIVVATYLITNWICPSQLSTAMVSNDQIECSGGTLGTNERFTLNLRFNRNPPSSVGGQLWVRLADTGKLMGPYAIAGP